MLLKNILIAAAILVMTCTQAVALQVAIGESDTESPQNSLTITEKNFSCFQSLQCLINENPFKKSNLDKIRLNSNQTRNYVIEGTSKNEEVYAEYDSSGKLIKATVVQRNIAVPRSISMVLAQGEYQSYKMIGNEVVIQNFDPYSMMYKIVLQNEDEVRVEYFDRYGTPRNRIS